MLSVGKITSGPAAVRYYLDQVAGGREDYYASKGEAPGMWVGSAAPALGWIGEVDGDDFASLLAGAGLRRARVDATSGFDLAFRAPKSVSVLWGVGPEWMGREVRAGHDAAVREALGYLEREACRARRGTDGVIQVQGGGFVGAAFVHSTSRAGDPLLHTHVVIGNMTEGPDGRWTALDGRHLYRHAKTAGFLYQAVLRRELTERLGVEWAAVEQGVADVRGVSRDVIEHFSRRRAEIVEHMAERGVTSAAAAQVAALETRRAKHHVTVDRLRAEWRARAAEHGLSLDAVERLVGQGVVRRPVLDGRLPAGLTDKASSFGRAELLQALAEAEPDGADIQDLEALADRLLGEREVVRLADGRAQAGVTEPRYSTRELLSIEAALVHDAVSRRRSRAGRLSPWTVERLVGDHPLLTPEQRHVVKELCVRGDGIAVIRAGAGTGKTFVLDTAREAWESEGNAVHGCALSARAALELESQAGIPSRTIASVLHELDRRGRLPHRSVLVVDEAGMVGTRDLARLADAARGAQAKLVLVGDDRQLPEIDAGGAFHALAQRVGALELHQVLRQHETWDRDALTALRNGECERWARAYLTRGRVTITATRDDACAALVADWSRAPGDGVMIAARRADVKDLNQRARRLLQQLGRLPLEELTIGRRSFAVGDRVITTRNDRATGTLNGQRGTVAAIDTARGSVTVVFDRGAGVTLDRPALAAGRLEHAYALTAHRAQGATVDETFVLGSEWLTREWAYTALSRHRIRARLYVTRADVETDLPAPNATMHGLARLVSNSGAKTLALESLERDAIDSPEWRLGRAPSRDSGLGIGL